MGKSKIFDKIRRASQQLPGRRKSSAVGFAGGPIQDNATVVQYQASFLGLPPEIRNQIYTYAAAATTLRVLPPKSDSKRPPPAGLLVVCRQVYQEYRSLLLQLAIIFIHVSEYSFGNLIRVLERLKDHDVTALLQNARIWIVLYLSHVPSRDDRRSLRAWCDYRGSNTGPYFGPGQPRSADLMFNYDCKFTTHMRPPRPASRYTNGYQMKLDLLRSHIRMYMHLGTTADVVPSVELQRMQQDMEQYAKLLDEAQYIGGETAVSLLNT